ncbi:MAG: hypothetical protein COB51_09255 [Moraxellaceae bacterium]|nr:MAG: hypothetical protein COB51_09255 [Moraxellaceae bacterium]
MIEIDSIFAVIHQAIDWLQPALMLIKGQVLYFSLSLTAAAFALLFLVNLRHYPSQTALNSIKLFLIVPVTLAVCSVAVNYLETRNVDISKGKEQQKNKTLALLKGQLTHLHETNMELEDKIQHNNQQYDLLKEEAKQLKWQLSTSTTNSNLKKLDQIVGISADRALKTEVARFKQFFESRKIQINPQQSAYFFNKSNSTLKMTLGFRPNKNNISYIEIENIYLDHIALPEELIAFAELTYFGYSADVIKAIYGPPNKESKRKKGLNNATQLKKMSYYLPLTAQSNLIADFTFKKDKLAIIKISWP